MTRKEIYFKIQRMLEIEKNRLLERHENKTLSYDDFKELSAKRTAEYREWEVDLMLANDNELEEKLSFIINTNLEKF